MKKSNEILEEFQNKLETISDKGIRIQEIVEFSLVYGDCYGFKIIGLLEEGIELAREIGDKAGETLCFCNLAFINRVTGVYVDSKYLHTLEELMHMVDEIKDHPNAYSMGLNMLSYFHWFRGEYEISFNLAFKSLKLPDQRQSTGVGWNYFALGVFYFDTKDFENSRMHYQKALDAFNEINHAYGIARSSSGLGTVAIVQNRISDVLPLLEYSAESYRKMSQYAGLSRAVNDMGLLEKTNGNYSKAVMHFKESIDLRKEIEHFQGLITSYTELGETYQKMKDHASALEQLEKGLELAIQINTQQKEMRLHKLMYDTYKVLNNTELALLHFEKFFEIKSKLLSDEAANNIKKIQTKFEKEKSEKETELERFKNVELKKANVIIEQKNKDITDSINYARRIQLGILPPTDVLEKCFKNYFVLYKPKDIVSGDFYWAVESTNKHTDQKLSIIAAIDCTGHGVPGAFMSMLGNTLLNQTISNPDIVNAADVLNYLNAKLPENLKSTGQEQHIRDGMDMALCIFDFKNMKMQFAGANNPCWIIRDNQLIELKGDKQPISASNDLEKRDFTNNTFDLRKNDCIYLLTDGFADQFGGPREKKFSYKRLKEELLTSYGKPCTEQKEILTTAFETWRGSYEQIDDVCIIGIKV